MLKRMVVRIVLSLALAVVGLSATACSQSAGEQDLSGQSHERHATGIESQVGDY